MPRPPKSTSASSGPEEARGGRGVLRPAILLLLKEQESHGYELVSRLGELGFEVSDIGGLYRTLRGMEEEGLVTSSWGTPSRGPTRRVYSITADGEQQLAESALGLVSQRRAIGEVLERYRGLVRQTRRRRGKGRRVLVVDDDDDIRHTLWVLLEQRGWEVEEAPDGETALERWDEDSHDVVVLDFRMPGMSGIDVAQHMREEGYEGPIVLYSAYLSPPLEDEAALLGLQTLAKADASELLDLMNHVGPNGKRARAKPKGRRRSE
jgi:poly-beta-hydroxybutyrate-responsive repressor